MWFVFDLKQINPPKKNDIKNTSPGLTSLRFLRQRSADLPLGPFRLLRTWLHSSTWRPSWIHYRRPLEDPENPGRLKDRGKGEYPGFAFLGIFYFWPYCLVPFGDYFLFFKGFLSKSKIPVFETFRLSGAG